MNTVDENIKKARRTAYSLMSAGFHGNNGLDPSTSIHILKTYVIPTITYGLEDLIPDKKNITRLDCFFKKTIETNIVTTSKCSRPCTIYHLWFNSNRRANSFENTNIHV